MHVMGNKVLLILSLGFFLSDFHIYNQHLLDQWFNSGKKKKFLQAFLSSIWINVIEETLEITRQIGKNKIKKLLLLATAYLWLSDLWLSDFWMLFIQTEYWATWNCNT